MCKCNNKPAVEIIRVERENTVNIPTYATDGSAAVDLVAHIPEPITIKPGETHLIPTGVRIHMHDKDLAAFIYPRSSMGHKHGLVLGNGVGVIDSDYQGEIMLSVHNRNPIGIWDENNNFVPNTEKNVTINPGDRIYQMVFAKVSQVQFSETSEFTQFSERGTGGFGSTGKN